MNAQLLQFNRFLLLTGITARQGRLGTVVDAWSWVRRSVHTWRGCRAQRAYSLHEPWAFPSVPSALWLVTWVLSLRWGMDELHLSLSFPFSCSAIKLGIVWSNCSVSVVRCIFLSPASVSGMNSALVGNSSLVNKQAERRKTRSLPLSLQHQSPLLLPSYKKLNCL